MALERTEAHPRFLSDRKFHSSKLELPEPWYLTEELPDPIKVDLGRQLFVDDYLIDLEKSRGFKKVYHQAVDVMPGPLVIPETASEKRSCSPLPDSVLYDPVEKEFKVWYVVNYEYVPHRLGMATSKDGINWTKKTRPSGQEFKTLKPCCDKCSKYNATMLKKEVNPQNLLCSIGGCRNFKGRGSGNVILDPLETDSAKRFKLLFGGFRNVNLLYSPDGIDWTSSDELGGWVGGSVWYLSYNPFRQKYIYFLRDNLPHPTKARITRMKEVDDLLEKWSKWEDGSGHGYSKIAPDQPVPWVMADPYDIGMTKRKPGSYCCHSVPYESLMINLISIYHGGDGFNKHTSLYAGYSRDGFSYTRPGKERSPLIPESQKKYYIVATGGNLCIVGERLFIYYFYKTGKCMYTGVATLRRDGFVSLQKELDKPSEAELSVEGQSSIDGDQQEAQALEEKKTEAEQDGFVIETKYLQSLQGKYLFLNLIQKNKKITVDLLDGQGKPVPGYQGGVASQSDDSVKQMVTWKVTKQKRQKVGRKVKMIPVEVTQSELPIALISQKFKLKFNCHLGTELYSFWLSPSQNGESNGYLGHGGPSYLSYQDTVDNYTRQQFNPNQDISDYQIPVDEALTRKSSVDLRAFDSGKLGHLKAPPKPKKHKPVVKKPSPVANKLRKEIKLPVVQGVITRMPYQLEQIEPVFALEEQFELDYSEDNLNDQKVSEGFNYISFNYLDLLQIKTQIHNPPRIRKDLNNRIWKIIGKPVYTQYRPRGGGNPKFGTVVTIKLLTCERKEIEFRMIGNSKSNAMIWDIKLENT